MLRTNLSTRPFYNERLVRLLLGALTLLVVGVTLFNLWQVFALSRQQSALQASIAEASRRATTFRGDAARIRTRISPALAEATALAAREANAVIGQRAFSWTELFNRFEDTLPDNVRISAVRPTIDRDGQVVVRMAVVARNVEGINTFIERLEQDGAFEGVLSTEEHLGEDGLLQATLEGRYAPPHATPQKGTVP
jgi:Tfp pilus assembly protein PilN